MSKVVIVRKDKRVRHKLLHAAAFAATGGASGILTAAKVASDASYNARTRQLQSQGEPAPRGPSQPATPYGADYDPAAEFRRRYGDR